MGLPAVVLQSEMQTATTQPSVSMRAGPQARGRPPAGLCRDAGVAWSACGAAKMDTIVA